MNNLLVGGTGFIGSALGRELITRGERVVSVSHFGKGNSDGVESIEVDLYRENCPNEIFEQADNVFILVGQIRTGFDPAAEKQIIMNMARPLRQSRARVFYFSTALVYGQTPTKATETSSCQPLDDYSRFKLDAEALFKNQVSPERLSILRLANIYGSPANRGFIGLLMDRLSDPNPHISLSGDGRQQRDYVFIDDLIHATIAITNNTTESGIVNISTGVSHSLIELIDLVSQASGQKIAYEITHNTAGGPQDSLIDNTRLEEVFGYRQFTPLTQGLSETLKRYKEQIPS